jgi:hypothetical protein
MPETATGVVCLAVPPFPSCPLVPRPQHVACPSKRIAHVWELPTETWTTVVMPVTATGVVCVAAVPPFPSCPFPPAPQHMAWPSESLAHVWSVPVEMFVALLFTNAGAGVGDLVGEGVGVSS